MGLREAGKYVPPEFKQRVRVEVSITDQDVTVVVLDHPVDGKRPARLWGRVITRPEGKSDAECARAACHALLAGAGGWVDLLGSEDVPLPIDF